jgi:hypothetical protein
MDAAGRGRPLRTAQGAGVDAVRTDAVYHADVYGADADLVVALHYDGVGGTGRAQYCMAATVHSGPSTEAADSRADAVVATWYDSYPAQLGFAGNGPITDGMTQYYGGWYRTADTPMLLIEHCIGADGGGIRADRPSPEAAARADFAASPSTSISATPRHRRRPTTTSTVTSWRAGSARCGMARPTSCA